MVVSSPVNLRSPRLGHLPPHSLSKCSRVGFFPDKPSGVPGEGVERPAPLQRLRVAPQRAREGLEGWTFELSFEGWARGEGCIAQRLLVFLLLTQQPRVRFSAFPEKLFRSCLFEIYQWRWIEKTGQKLEISIEPI